MFGGVLSDGIQERKLCMIKLPYQRFKMLKLHEGFMFFCHNSTNVYCLLGIDLASENSTCQSAFLCEQCAES